MSFGGGFNQTPFNRPWQLDIFVSFTIDHSNNLAFKGGIVVHPRFEIDHSINMGFEGLRDKASEFVMNLVQGMQFEGMRERTTAFEMNMALEMLFSSSKRQVLSLTFTGEFEPGDKVIINADQMKITKNGQNALQDMDGDFISLYMGDNLLTWTDDQEERNIKIRLEHRDRFM